MEVKIYKIRIVVMRLNRIRKIKNDNFVQRERERENKF
mgnify:CR=1 FL=1